MPAYEPPHVDPAEDDTRDDVYSDPSGGASASDEHTLWYDEALDTVHDAEGHLDDAHTSYGRDESGAWMRRYTAHAPLLVRLWWQARWLVYTSAFLTPLVVFAILLLVVALLTGESDESSAPGVSGAISATSTSTLLVTPEWPTDLVFAAHTIPTRIRNEITVPGTQHGYAFEGELGVVWMLAVEPYQDSGLTPQLALYGPDGARICSDATCIAGQPQSSMNVVLDAQGTYRVVVENSTPIGTGLYLFTLDTQ